MYDLYNRRINYLRISVTDRCNLRCTYCMPPGGVFSLNHSDILSFEEIFRFTEVAVRFGIDKVRITGGEPLVRKNIVTLVKMISGISGIKDFSLTTNGTMLQEYAQKLKDAGLNRVNISLDTIDPVKYYEITRGGNLQNVLDGIDAAAGAGLFPVKINCVVNKSSEEEHSKAVREFCNAKNLTVRFIQQMSLKDGTFSVVEGGTGGNCGVCNKLRLSSNGDLSPCLFNDTKFNIRKYSFEEVIRMAVGAKPERGTYSINNAFNKIGG